MTKRPNVNENEKQKSATCSISISFSPFGLCHNFLSLRLAILFILSFLSPGGRKDMTEPGFLYFPIFYFISNFPKDIKENQEIKKGKQNPGHVFSQHTFSVSSFSLGKRTEKYGLGKTCQGLRHLHFYLCFSWASAKDNRG